MSAITLEEALRLSAGQDDVAPPASAAKGSHAGTLEDAQALFGDNVVNEAAPPKVIASRGTVDAASVQEEEEWGGVFEEKSTAKTSAENDTRRLKSAFNMEENETLYESTFLEDYDDTCRSGVIFDEREDDSPNIAEATAAHAQAHDRPVRGPSASASSIASSSSASSAGSNAPRPPRLVGAETGSGFSSKRQASPRKGRRRVSVGWLQSQDDGDKIALAGLLAVLALNRKKDDGVTMDDKSWFDSWVEKVVVKYLSMPKEVTQGILPLGVIESDPAPLARQWLERYSDEDRERAFGEMLAQNILNIGSGADQRYDARTHRCLLLLSSRLGVSAEAIEEFEDLISSLVSESASSVSNEKAELTDEEKAEKSRWKRMRNLKVGAAAVGGAVLIGVTGGLALPALGASLATFGGVAATTGAFMASAGGTALFTTLFTAGGMGLTGYKVNRRIGGLREFEFRKLWRADGQPFRNGLHVCICVSGWHVQRKQANYVAKDGDEDVCFVESPRASSAPPKTAQLGREQSSSSVEEDAAGKEEEAGAKQTTTTTTTSLGSEEEGIGEETLSTKEDKQAKAALVSDGTVSKRNVTQKVAVPYVNNHEWSECTTRFRATLGEPYQLVWENEALRDVSQALTRFSVNQVMNAAVKETLKTTALAAVMSAIAWPAFLVSSFDYIDNSWAVAINRARFAGEELARAILSGAHGHRPVTLIGHSIGALVIFHCLTYMAKKSASRLQPIRSDGIVLNVFLFGAPITASSEEWKSARSVVSGHLVNCFAPNDWILAILFRASLVSVAKIAGLYRVDLPGVTDVDLSESGIISSQVDYHKKMDEVMEYVMDQITEL